MTSAATPASLLLLCQRGGWDSLHQVASAAAAATSVQRPVTVILFRAALAKVATGRLDEVTLVPRDPDEEQRLKDLLEERAAVLPSGLFAAARRTGLLTVLACSASAALVAGDDEARGGSAVLEDPALPLAPEEVVGWPTILRLMEKAGDVLQF